MISGLKYDAAGNRIEPDRYDIIHSRSGDRVGTAKTYKGAYRSVDNNDNKYGGYAHHAQAYYSPDNEESERVKVRDT